MADVEQVSRDIVRARDPVAALARALDVLSPAEAVHVVDSVFYRMPALFDGGVLRAAAAAYGSVGETEAALLLDGLAAQMGRPKAAPSGDARGEALAVLTAPDPQSRLRSALEVARLPPADAADLVLRVWGRLPVVTDYWIVHRATEAFERAGRIPAAMVLAGYALQLVPGHSRSGNPAATLLRGLLRRGRYAAAQAVATAWLRPPDRWIRDEPWPGDLAAAAQARPLPPPPRVGYDVIALVPADIRPALTGLPDPPACPACLQELKAAQPREPITLYRLLDADVFLHADHVAVFGTDGTPYPELSVGDPPLRVRAAAAGAPTVARRRAVVVSDLFPVPNLCHFLCDQAPKLALYRRAGIRLDTASVIGARLSRPFQTEIARRFGASEWLPTDLPLRVRVAELSVLSTCAENQHPAHLGAPWALDAIRGAFGVTATAAATGAAIGNGGRRLYISRSDAAARRVVNEAELLSVLLPAGFEVVLPGSLAVADQAAVFGGASHVIGAHGAGLTNIAFCTPGTRVLEMFHPRYGTYAFAILAQAARLDYRPIVAEDASLDDTEAPDAPYGIGWIGRDMRVDVAAVSRWIDEGAASEPRTYR